MRGRWRRWAPSLLLLALSALLCLGIVEALLRARPDLFGARLGNYVFGRYGTFPGGIYFREPESRLRVMWRDFETRAYANGYFWHHATDRFGFRNPPGARPPASCWWATP
jgi:hypothetical protein